MDIRKRVEDGSVIVSILVITVFLSVVISGLVVLASSNLTRARSRVFLLQAQYAAESGADAAIAQLNAGNTTYTGSASEVTILTNSQYRSTYTMSVASGETDKQRVITAVGKVYAPATASTARFSRTIEVIAERSSTSTGVGLMSRNIIYIDSGVKTIQSKDIYANGFIQMNKNTTDLIAENITVADKNTGASNCSIGGSGDLVKPTTFSTPGQTKTNIITAYNNCISPPGNTSNSNFNVSANQTNVSKIASMYIPWSQYMDNSYTNAGSCSDWTTGSSPRDIPKVNGSKATHYPDSNSNVDLLTCGLLGSFGDLSLGGSMQYNIKQNVHLRASMCGLIACNPTFYNPDSTIKWIFVEGVVNFDSVKTAPGSGPIVMVVYGADPITKILSCPYGGAAYIGNDNSQTNAPALYLLAMNGICVDKTKFGASPALGGLGGKNIYIASNPGTPFDLKLDPLFPTNQIPIDLAWKATRYRRL